MELPLGELQEFRHLYVHVPFCRHKCGYCDFNAYAGMDRLIPEYLDAVVGELEIARRSLPFGALRTVYLGGGTPSVVPAGDMSRFLARIASLFDIEPDAEVTLEANPASTDDAKLSAWRAAGVNRLSLGVQGFDRRALAVLERRTDGMEAVRAFEAARAAGFANISLDLIYAVPFQDEESWLDTLARGAGLRPEHISCYCLTIEEGTLLARRAREGRLPAVDPDLQWSLLDLTTERLAALGYSRYEVSNWSLPGFESRHNHAYWACRPVYGAGAGAHSYARDGARARRWWNLARPRDYIRRHTRPIEDGEELGPRKAAAEALMMGLRTRRGVEADAAFEAEMRQLADAGLVERVDGHLMPTRRGLDLHNQIALAVL